MMKRKRKEGEVVEEKKIEMDIVWQTPANPPVRHDYIFRNGRRHVRPYYFEFIAHVKNRWAGKTIVDLFAEEFKGRPYEYYVSAVKSGRIQVDGEMVPVSYIVKSSQKISHFLHRHEPPVLALDVSILHKEPEVVTICKPASVPVHPCGQYRKNTVVGILQAEYDLAPLFPIHRLDRLVSGLLILARSASKADVFRQQIEAGQVQKQYVARVIGVFPEHEKVVEANINYNAREGKSTAEVLNSGDTKIKGKTACTKFTRISTNGIHSIVSCQPITGRTHQIRVHLQHAGHPIANDILYLSDEVVDRSTEGMSVDRTTACSDCSCKNEENSTDDFSIDPMCTNCPNLAPKGYGGHEEGLWLHCVRYSGPDWAYECPYPDWASLN
ncbi:RNA pseudouridine synthase 7 [Cannabis sativa]|uniref:RNA pseudouridine synthase 7 n=1 Tax=Cannabis sativa TaxID=3483 RepID=UPI0029CAA372|nr:RNA pseudouridine synthase 7 [Cannabis sativa]